MVLHHRQFPAETLDDSYRIFAKRLQQADYERHWKMGYKGPGFGSHVLAVVVKVLPKVGIISLLAIKIPEPKTEELYVKSVDHTVDAYIQILSRLRSDPGADLDLANLDLDTGEPVKPGVYRLTDKTYAQLLARLTSNPVRSIPEGVRRNILEFYADPEAPNTSRKTRRPGNAFGPNW